jgi:hypothetical protein
MKRVGSLTVKVRNAPVARTWWRGFAKLGCAERKAAFNSGTMTESGMADAGRDWPCRRGVMQSCLRRFPWGASFCLKPALSLAKPIFSQGPSCREVEDWAMARERPASRMVTAVKIAPNLVLILDTGFYYTSNARAVNFWSRLDLHDDHPRTD